MMASHTRPDLSLPVRLIFHDGTDQTVRLIYSGCTEAVLMLESGQTILRSAVRSAGVTFDFTGSQQLAA